MVAGAADMIRRRGLNATSVRELAKHAQAPLGSTYHYFPGGKAQLAAEAVRFADALAARKLARGLPAGPVAGLRSFVDMWRKVLVDNDFQAGCPVLAVSIEDRGDDDEPQRAAASAFENWTGLLARSLRDHGANEVDAEQTATLIVAAVEGTVAMCRVERSPRALDQVVDKLEFLIRTVTVDRVPRTAEGGAPSC
ncbi:TetR/AcrR family transcriptional regulator [Nocardia araoensis]|uniref:TetR/AcrR family transcriptional regulator n=1 Tax=Nocardia araoensis TaxID=228600 RepID=UPI0007C84539|nr:TetR/AcrR family transcriptional regulator [Nocardia araoensis]